LNIPTCIVVHADHWFLQAAIRAVKGVGPVTVFVSKRGWDGREGDWQKCKEVAELEGAEVVVGDWPNEAVHRRMALEEMKARGHRHVLVPDGDEIIEPALLETLARLAEADIADVTRVSMETYWKSPRYRINPPEQLRPVLMVNAQTSHHVHIREYEGPRTIVLDPEHGKLHHLSYAGPNERIQVKIRSWGHRHEVVEDWYRNVWLGWDRDRLMRNLHPTHPPCYACAERVPVQPLLADCRDDVPAQREVGAEPAKPWPVVSIIVPLYGGPEDIKACLESLRECEPLFSEVIVVDDASPDDAPEAVTQFEFATLIRNEVNLGFSGTCNRGYAASKGEVIVFLNSDTIVTKAGLFRLIESLSASHTIGAVGPRTNYCGGPQRIEPTYSSLAHLDLFAQDFANRDLPDSDAAILIGFCIAARRSALDEVAEAPGKAFDERFGRGMFEDNDLSYRLLRAGYKLRIAERAYIHHGGNHSLARTRESFAALLHRNERLFHAKWHAEIECGFASHLPDHRNLPIVFQPSRHPDVLRREMALLRDEADVSLCMIVRDEERVIGDCLSSVAGVFKQIVVVDTGSQDRTCDIVLEHDAELHRFPWTESFSEARNESLRHAVGRWIFWMDADDTLPKASAEAILRAAATAPPDVVAFVVPVRFTDGGSAGGTQVDHVKLFRNLPGLQFEGRIHEQILGSLRETGGQIARLDAVVLHSGYDTSAEGQAKKRARDERLLTLDLNERPQHPFVLFNLGMTAHYLGDHEAAVSWLSQSISVATPSESHVRKAYALMGLSKREMGDLDGALAIFSSGLMAVGEDPELRFQSALVLSAQGKWEEARQQYLSMATDVSGFFSSVDMGILGPKRAHNLGTVCLALERYGEAKEHLWAAARMGFMPAIQALFEAAMLREDLRTAREAVDVWRQMAPRDSGWAEALVDLANTRGENPDVLLHSFVDLAGAAIVLSRRLLAQGKEPVELLQALDEDGVAEAAFYRGVACSRRGEFSKALEHMRRAQFLNPAHAPTNEQIAHLEDLLYEGLGSLSSVDESAVVGSHPGVLSEATCPASVVVVTYNSASTISECLLSVLQELGPHDELIVVDNKSADTTLSSIGTISDSRLRVIANDENVGYARGANQGLLISGGETIVLLNPDVVVYPGWLAGLSSRLTNGVGAVGPVSDQIGSHQGLDRFLQTAPPADQVAAILAKKCEGQTKEVKFLSGVCLAFKRQVLNQSGLLDEAMELGADDLELSWRLRLLGHRLVVAADVFVRHVGSVSFSSLDRSVANEWVQRSDAALVAKLKRHFGADAIPSSWALWGCDIFEKALSRSSAAVTT